MNRIYEYAPLGEKGEGLRGPINERPKTLTLWLLVRFVLKSRSPLPPGEAAAPSHGVGEAMERRLPDGRLPRLRLHPQHAPHVREDHVAAFGAEFG